MFHQAGDSRHTQNIQINNVIVENEKCVFYFMEKATWTFWPTQHTCFSRQGDGTLMVLRSGRKRHILPDLVITG